MLSVSEVKSTCRFHHSASRRGYVSRKSNGFVEPYSGRFGTGYVIVTPRFDTTRYVDVSYYLTKEVI